MDDWVERAEHTSHIWRGHTKQVDFAPSLQVYFLYSSCRLRSSEAGNVSSRTAFDAMLKLIMSV